KRFIVLQVKTMSALHRAAGTRQWKSRLSSSGRCSRRDGGAPRPSSRRPRRPLDPALQWSRSGWLPYLGRVTILLLTGPSRASAHREAPSQRAGDYLRYQHASLPCILGNQAAENRSTRLRESSQNEPHKRRSRRWGGWESNPGPADYESAQ